MCLANSPDIGPKEVHLQSQVTVQWLESILKGDVVGAAVEDFRALEGHQGMTDRQRLQITWNKAGQDAGLPTAIFIKATPATGLLRETCSMLHMADLESNIYNKLHKELKGLIRNAYYSRSYPGGRFIIVMEDITARGIKPHWMGDDCSVGYAFAVAKAQAQIHSRFLETERFGNDLVWIRPRSSRYGETWLEDNFEHNRIKFLASKQAKTVSEYTRQAIILWQKHWRTINRYCETLPATLPSWGLAPRQCA
jgi:hypothetical protein